MLARPKTSAFMAVVFALLAGLMLIYNGYAGQQGDPGEEVLPVRYASYSPVELDVGQPIFVTAGDIDGDSHMDLVLLSFGITEQGHTAQTRVHLIKMDWATGIAHIRLLLTIEDLAPYCVIHDCDSDGQPDLIVFDNKVGAFIVLRGDGHGTFEEDLIVVDRHGFVGNFAVADVDGDCYADLVFADLQLGYVGILWGGGHCKLAGSSAYALPAGHHLASVVIGDFTGDGRHEVAVLGLRADGIGWVYFVALFSVDRNRQLSMLSTTDIGDSDLIALGAPLAVGDYNCDGNLDLLTVRSEHGYALLGHGNGTFSVEEIYWLLGEKHVSQIILADLDGDGCLNDIVVGQGSARVWITTGCYGGPRFGLVVPVIGLPVSAAVADVNGDGALDVIIASNSLRGSTYLEVFLGTKEASDEERAKSCLRCVRGFHVELRPSCGRGMPGH